MVGSTACAMTMVACGRADAYFGAGFHIWDIAAGLLIIDEAGGKIDKINGNQMSKIKLKASSTNIYSKMMEKLDNF